MDHKEHWVPGRELWQVRDLGSQPVPGGAMAGERQRQAHHAEKVGIYLVGYGGERGKSRERQRERVREKVVKRRREVTSSGERWKGSKDLRLEAEGRFTCLGRLGKGQVGLVS